MGSMWEVTVKCAKVFLIIQGILFYATAWRYAAYEIYSAEDKITPGTIFAIIWILLNVIVALIFIVLVAGPVISVLKIVL